MMHICHAEPSVGVQPVLLEVSGMKCGGCSAAVKRILLSQPEVVNAASVNLLTESAAVTFTPSAVAGASAEHLAAQAAEALSKKVPDLTFYRPSAHALLDAARSAVAATMDCALPCCQ